MDETGGALFDGKGIRLLKEYFSDLRRREETLMRCGRAVTDRLSSLGLAMVAHMEAAEYLVLQARLALDEAGWSTDVEAEEARSGRYLLLACFDLHHLVHSHESGIRVFKAYWSDGRWWGDGLTSHWTPYAWRDMPAAPALPAAVMDAWGRHGFGKADGEVERLAGEAADQA